MLVKGGITNAGSKRGKQPARKQMWTCPECNRENAAHWITCPTYGCREKRP